VNASDLIEMDAKKDSSLLTKESLAPLFAGVSGGALSTVLLFPLDIIKVRLQVNEESRSVGEAGLSNNKHRLGSLRVFRGIVKHEGMIGLYQGLTPALVGSAVAWGGYFFIYEGFKQRLKTYKGSLPNGSPTLTSLDNFGVACSAGAVMVFTTNPLWLIKLRMQLQMKQAAEQLNASHTHYNGIFHAARTIVKEEGYWALYKGAGPALLLTAHGGVQFVVYEFLRKHFHVSRTQRDTSDSYQSILERLEKSLGYLTMGAASKM
jgi:solute carrier family 25 folate transporter 32